jgi:hypothetical protein
MGASSPHAMIKLPVKLSMKSILCGYVSLRLEEQGVCHRKDKAEGRGKIRDKRLAFQNFFPDDGLTRKRNRPVFEASFLSP